ncbi:MAG: glycoside hydrolase family 78 protein [Bacilli bacterium]|jgi:alpha-L-rhamnosidase|nr:glycoside hydrolase family 78 protein [Bacilli bacterium]
MGIKDLRVNREEGIVYPRLENLVFSFLSDTGEKTYRFCLYDENKKKLFEQKVSLEEASLFRLAYQFEKGKGYYWQIEGKKDKSDFGYFETEIDFDPELITVPLDITHPVIKKDFKSVKKIKKARLYIAGLGLYVAFLNGNKVGDLYLTPGFNDYTNYVRYQTYDVTDSIHDKNELKVYFGDGWYKGRIGFSGEKGETWGNDYILGAILKLTYEDGTEEEISTDESFEYARSKNLFSNIYDGQKMDLNIEEKDFKPCLKSDKVFEFVSQDESFIKKIGELKGKLIVSKKGEQIIDFGQNAAGYVSFKLHAPKGTKVVLSYGEVLQGGCFYNANLRTAKSELEVISDGKEQQIDEYFTYHGGRYVKVEGLEKVDPADFTWIVLSSFTEPEAEFHCANKEIEKVVTNTLWGQRGNFIDIPTDCPQRDERMGWTADTQVFSRTAMMNGECYGFYKKFIDDLSYDQKAYCQGDIPPYSPYLKKSGQMGGAVWADVITILPMNLYKAYGDKVLLKKHAESMKLYCAVLIEHDKKTFNRHLILDGFTFGDWLALDGVDEQAVKGGTDDNYIQSMYFFYSLSLTAEALKIVGEKEEAEYFASYAKKVRKAILEEFFSVTGRLCIDTQTGYILSLFLGVYLDKEKIISGLKARLTRDNNSLKTGFTGTPLLLPVLFDNGFDSIAYSILLNTGYPGWIYQVRLGATTVWERWNSILPDGSISGTGMNSLNHYANGSVVEAIYTRVVGLKPAAPAWHKAIIEPHLSRNMLSASLKFNSPSGLYFVSYEIDQTNTIHFVIDIPFGGEAEAKLPEKEKQILKAGHYVFNYQLKKDYVHRLSCDSTFAVLAADPFAMRVLQKFPFLMQIINNPMAKNFTPNQVAAYNNPILHFDQNDADRLAEELKKI